MITKNPVFILEVVIAQEMMQIHLQNISIYVLQFFHFLLTEGHHFQSRGFLPKEMTLRQLNKHYLDTFQKQFQALASAHVRLSTNAISELSYVKRLNFDFI